jgi:hypothetical protein
MQLKKEYDESKVGAAKTLKKKKGLHSIGIAQI